MIDKKNLGLLWNMLDSLKGIRQDLRYHPEGNAWEHSVQCFKAACRDTNDIDLILAAMMHDVGKQVESRGHEKHSVEMLTDYCSVKTLFLVEQHMRFKVYLSGEMKKKGKIDFIFNHPWLPEMVALNRFDNAARKPKETAITYRDVYDTLMFKAELHFIREES